MTWLAFRQFRLQAAIAALALVAVGIIVVATEPGLAHLYDTTVGACPSTSDCSSVVARFLATDSTLQYALDAAVVVVPGVLGAFWGAPLVAREIEAGTFRLAWTQSVSRTRWLLVKLVLVGLASAVAAGLLSLAVTWWFSPLHHASMNQFASFDRRGVVPIAYAAFGFAVGVVSGLVVRRTLPSMAITLIVLVLFRVGVADVIRPNLLSPATETIALTSDPGIGYVSHCDAGICTQATIEPGTPTIPDAWVYSVDIASKTGTPLTSDVVTRQCPALAQGAGGGPPASTGGGSNGSITKANGNPLAQCAATLGSTYRELVRFQPANRYWPLQWAEFGIFLALAAVMGGAGLWWIRRREV